MQVLRGQRLDIPVVPCTNTNFPTLMAAEEIAVRSEWLVWTARPMDGKPAVQQMDLTGPELDFVHLAAGMGVEGVRVEKADAIAPALTSAVAANRPYLIEIAIEGKR